MNLWRRLFRKEWCFWHDEQRYDWRMYRGTQFAEIAAGMNKAYPCLKCIEDVVRRGQDIESRKEQLKNELHRRVGKEW